MLYYQWAKDRPEDVTLIEKGLQQVLKRLVSFPVPTIAAINGHAFGAGAIFAIAHDYRVMREDKGWFCVPAVNIGIVLPTSFGLLLR